MDLDQAFYDRLSGDGTLVALLSTYRTLPAVFTADPVPEDADLPYVVTAGTVGDLGGAFDTKNAGGREILKDVRCYAEDTGSASLVESIKERVRVLFHRHALAVTGFTTAIAEVVGITPVDEDGVYGRVVSVRLSLTED